MIELVLRYHDGQRKELKFAGITEYTNWLFQGVEELRNPQVRGFQVREMVECLTHDWDEDIDAGSRDPWVFKCDNCPATTTVTSGNLDAAYRNRVNR
jgi:hypothetical protein